MSFLRYFFTKNDRTHSLEDGGNMNSIEANRMRFAVERKRQFNCEAGVDHDSRISCLEDQLADAALIIETLIELLEEKMDLSRKEIEERLEKLATPPSVVDAIPESIKPAEPVPHLLTPEDSEKRFQPRRRWRDARGQL
jgi:hypothetical protein